MPSNREGSNAKPILPSFQSLLRGLDDLGPLHTSMNSAPYKPGFPPSSSLVQDGYVADAHRRQLSPLRASSNKSEGHHQANSWSESMPGPSSRRAIPLHVDASSSPPRAHALQHDRSLNGTSPYTHYANPTSPSRLTAPLVPLSRVDWKHESPPDRYGLVHALLLDEEFPSAPGRSWTRIEERAYRAARVGERTPPHDIDGIDSPSRRTHHYSSAEDDASGLNGHVEDKTPSESDSTILTPQMSAETHIYDDVSSQKSGAELNGLEGRLARYPCSYCGKRFNRPSSLKIHVNIHTGDRPFVCSVPGCDRTFSVLSNMRRHTKTHGVSSNASSPPPPASTVDQKSKHQPPISGSQSIDDELIDELESPQPTHSSPSLPMRGSQSVAAHKRRKLRLDTDPSGTNRNAGKSRSSPSFTATGPTYPRSATGDGADDLDELLGGDESEGNNEAGTSGALIEAPTGRRQRIRSRPSFHHATVYYTSSEDSDA